MVYDLLFVSDALRVVRSHLGSLLGLSGPQYVLLMAITRRQGEDGLTGSALAAYLRVTNAFVAAESRVLTERGFIDKRPNPRDGRSVLIVLTPKGRRLIERVAPRIQAVNDRLFGCLDRDDFIAAKRIFAGLAETARVTVEQLEVLNAAAALAESQT